MSLLLKGSPTQTVYKQATEESVVSSTAHAVYVRFIPAANASAPFTFLKDGDLASASRGFSLTQNSPTSMTVGWITSGGANEHTFTVETGMIYDVMSVYDRTDGTVDHYVNTDTPAATFVTVGTPIDNTKYCVRILSSLVADEDVVIGDLAVWNNGKPDSAALTAMDDKSYLGYAFKNSACSDRYVFAGASPSTPTISYFNLMRANQYLTLEQEASGADPKSGSSTFICKPATIRTGVSSDTPGNTYVSQMFINQAKMPYVPYNKGEGNTLGVDALISEGYYDPALGKFNSLPPRYDGMQSWQHPVQISVGQNRTTNPTMNTGTYVVEFDGSATLVINGSTVINSNRYEANNVSGINISAINPATGLSDVRAYLKTLEPAVIAGREFTPESISQYGRFDTIRTVISSDVNRHYIGGMSDTKSNNDFFNSEISVEAQVQLALESDSSLWWCVSAFLGSDIAPNSTNLTSGDFTAFGVAQYSELSIPKIEAYFNNFVSILNAKGWHRNKPIMVELDNHPWRIGFQYGSANRYLDGIRQRINTLESASLVADAGIGFMSVFLMNEFKKALVAGGRATQVWSPVLSTPSDETYGPVVIDRILSGAEYYINTRSSSIAMSDYVVATSSWMPAATKSVMDWTATNDVLGVAYPVKADYYTALRAMIADTPEMAHRLFYNKQMQAYQNHHYVSLPAIRGYASARGIVKPIEEFEGGSNNNPANIEWRETELREFFNNHNKGTAGSALQRINIEAFAQYNPGGLVANTYLVGDTGTSNPVGYYDATLWTTLPDSKTWQVWTDYIAAERDPAVVWNDHLLYVDEEEPLNTVVIDEDGIRDDYEVVTLSTADASRAVGSIFNSARFDAVDLEGAEFFYKEILSDAVYTPILANGFFTGYFNISGSASSVATMYVHDIVNSDWYEIVVSTSGPTIGYSVNNVLNAELETGLYVNGIVYGVSGTTLSGTGIEFSNNSSTWTDTIALINGVTQYRKLVTSSATADTLTAIPISISDGTTNFTNSADVVTRVGLETYFEDDELEITFLENTLTSIVTAVAVSDGVVTYSLTGDDAALFAIDENGAVTPIGIISYEDPIDTDEDGIYEFTVVATTDTDTSSIDIFATVTDVAEHAFTFPSISNRTEVIPASNVEVSSALLDGISGVPFSVSGLTSSTDGGVTYSTTDKNYVAGSTYIKLSGTAPSSYNATETFSGTISWSGGSESVDVSYDVTTKSALIQVEFGGDATISHQEGTTIVAAVNTVTAGDGTYEFSLTDAVDNDLFVVNTTTGVISWKLPPDFDSVTPENNTYYVEVVVTNTDGYSTTSDTKVLTITVVSAGQTAYDMPDQNIAVTSMSDGSWTTSPNANMSIIGSPSGAGTENRSGYHDVIRFVKFPRTRTVTVTSIGSATNGTAAPAFSGKYLVAQPSSTSNMSMNVTVTDDNANTISFTYNIDVT